MKLFSLVCLISVLFFSCSETYNPQQVSDAYCECAQLSESEKFACVKEWSIKYSGVLSTDKDRKEVNYSMIECNGFEGDNDFYLKLMRN